MAEIEMPQLGETVTEGTITQWFKQVGDQVAEDEVLFEVSTDKVDSEVPSPVSGYLTEILVPEGETVDVGTRLAVVSSEQVGGDTVTPAVDTEPAPQPPAEQLAPEEPAPAQPAPPPAAEPPGGDGGGVLLSPVVRRLVRENDLDPASIAGSGEGGRITRSDVERHLQDRRSGGDQPTADRARDVAPEARPPMPPPIAPAQPGAAPATAPHEAPPPRVTSGDTAEPFNNIRRRTAEHMVRSKAVSPHAYLAMEVDYERVERARTAHKAQFRAEDGVALTYLPFVARALIDAIEEFPHVNASVGEAELIVHNDVHLGIAVDLSYEGLIVPVLHDAQDKRLRAIARDMAHVAERARTKKLSADDITGGTVTITNVGSTGNLLLMPVINQPQVMILSTDGVSRRPVVVTDPSGGESIAIRSVGNLTLGWDHRAFDGAYAADFLARVRDILQTRDWETEL